MKEGKYIIRARFGDVWRILARESDIQEAAVLAESFFINNTCRQVDIRQQQATGLSPKAVHYFGERGKQYEANWSR